MDKDEKKLDELSLFEWIKPPTIQLGANFHANIRYCSVKGAAGFASLVALGYWGYCFCNKKPCSRQLVVAATFGLTYCVLEYKDRTSNHKPTSKEASNGENKESPNDEAPTSNNTKPFELKTYSQLKEGASNDPDMWLVECFVAKGLVNWLLAGSGIGKSLFMVQIAVAVSSGKIVEFLPDDCIIPPKMFVVFYRVEVFASEYPGKYGDGKILEDAGIKWRDRNDLTTPDFKGLVADLKQLVETVNVDTLICIDPISKFEDFDAGKFAEEAEVLMKRSHEKGYRLTFLCSAHLDEVAPWKPVTTSDIRGGDRLIQTAGSAFTIRMEKTDEAYRYLKSLKQPKGYAGDDNVLVCKIVSGENFPHGEYVCHKSEAEALPQKPKPESDKLVKETNTEATAPKRNPNIEWTEEMNDKLKELYGGGVNDSQIAKTMSSEFDLALSSTQIDRQLIKCGLRPPKPGGKKK